jgi:cellulose synthase (UDP-forming)
MHGRESTQERQIRPTPAGSRRDAEISPRREIMITIAVLVFTLVVVALLVGDIIGMGERILSQGSAVEASLLLLFTILVASLIYGGLVYQATRLGYMRRLADSSRSGPEPDESGTAARSPRALVLIPSYREEPAVVRQTLLSVALQEYPDVSLRLLIDDPPDPTSIEDGRLLDQARHLPAEVSAVMDPIAAEIGRAAEAFHERASGSPRVAAIEEEEVRRLTEVYIATAASVEHFAPRFRGGVPAHVQALFEKQVIHASAQRLRERASQLTSGESPPTFDDIDEEYRRLSAMFKVDIASFERKSYLNLSHEPNKAMNLNAYISLTGGHWREEQTTEGTLLVRDERQGQAVPDADYFVTLDADSLIAPEYIATLVGLMERPENRRLAVAQTPYSAAPDPTSRLERIAGATTDIQYVVHQGFTRHGATYWVGANAVIRKAALEDIAERVPERGFEVTRYIHDRTVIEDTESSVDLLAKGWSLYNHPRRLSFSATPPDFGSLVVQRQRWANGGLIILPKLLRHMWGHRRVSIGWAIDSLVQAHYLVSIAATNVALLLLLLVPFSAAYMSVWLPLTAAGYFGLYARDLSQNGYRYRDLFNVYALNLVLLPVNLAGVLKSVEQGIRKSKIPFARTPKVDGRTMAPARYLVALVVLLVLWSLGAFFDVGAGRLPLALFATANVVILAYGIAAFIGWRSLVEDLAIQVRGSARAARPAVGWWRQPSGSID